MSVVMCVCVCCHLHVLYFNSFTQADNERSQVVQAQVEERRKVDFIILIL